MATLTQKGSITILRTYLGLTQAQFADADATECTDNAFKEMDDFWRVNQLAVPDYSGKPNLAEFQEKAEQHLASSRYFLTYANRKEVVDSQSDGIYPGSINLGGVSINSTETNSQRRTKHYNDQAKIERSEYSRYLGLLMAELDCRVQSVFL